VPFVAKGWLWECRAPTRNFVARVERRRGMHFAHEEIVNSVRESGTVSRPAERFRRCLRGREETWPRATREKALALSIDIHRLFTVAVHKSAHHLWLACRVKCQRQKVGKQVPLSIRNGGRCGPDTSRHSPVGTRYRRRSAARERWRILPVASTRRFDSLRRELAQAKLAAAK